MIPFLMQRSFANFRVLHLVRSLRVGGLEKVVVDLTRGLAQRGVANYLGCLLDAGEWANQADVKGTWIGNLETRNPVSVFFSLWRYVKRNKIDIIHTHNSHPHKYGVPLSVVTGIPLVHTKHGRNWPDNPRWVWFSRQLSRFTKVIVAVSRDIEQVITGIERVPQRKVVTILNGVDIGEYDRTILRPSFAPLRRGRQDYSERDVSRRDSVREKVGVGRGVFVIGSVGRFSPEKQYPWLVGVFGEFHKEVPNSVLVLVGDGPDRTRIEAAISSQGLSGSVLLPGMQSDVREWLHCMDVFCLSSDQEGTSITLLEAGAMGVPSVVTDVGGNGEIVEEGVTGFVLPGGDAEAMRDGFLRLACDAQLRCRMGAAARSRMERRYSL